MAKNAKVFVWKEDEEGQKPWKVGTEDLEGFVIVRKEFETYQDAWDWLQENYVRETP